MLSLLIPLMCLVGCAQKRLVSPETQLLHEEDVVSEEAYRKIDKDLDALYDELKASERVLGTPLDRKIYDTLKHAKQAVRKKDFEKSSMLYRQTIELARDHLVDESAINAFRRALANIEKRHEGNGPCEDAWADLMALTVKQQLLRIIIPELKFEPPATLIDAMDFFKQASRDYADPKTPVEQRGVSLALLLSARDANNRELADNEDPFAVSATHSDAPVLPKIHARFISLYDALKLVCDVTGYTFDIRGGCVMITPIHDGPESNNENTDTKKNEQGNASGKNTR